MIPRQREAEKAEEHKPPPIPTRAPQVRCRRSGSPSAPAAVQGHQQDEPEAESQQPVGAPVATTGAAGKRPAPPSRRGRPARRWPPCRPSQTDPPRARSPQRPARIQSGRPARAGAVSVHSGAAVVRKPISAAPESADQHLMPHARAGRHAVRERQVEAQSQHPERGPERGVECAEQEKNRRKPSVSEHCPRESIGRDPGMDRGRVSAAHAICLSSTSWMCRNSGSCRSAACTHG